jgi:DNA-binding CsgD family transcriptional regulator/thioredoxin-like negative regulator of GroEL
VGLVEELVRARADYERGDWAAALTGWREVDPDTLGADDLMRLGTACWLSGRYDDYVEAMQRAFQIRSEAGEAPGAARAAGLVAIASVFAGQHAVAGGWEARLERILDELGHDVVERGYRAILQMFRHIGAAEWSAAAESAAAIGEYGHRFRDPDLIAMGLCAQGRLTLYTGRVPEGLALFDEAMVGIAAGDVSPIFAGTVYCTMIEGCQEVSDFGRAAEWTSALNRWCAKQPGLVPFTGQCAVHRGQMMALTGAWPQALEEFDAAVRRYQAAARPDAVGLALNERGDVLRRLGEYDAAEGCYEEASSHGYEPQPGLALLWLTRGRTRAALAAVHRLLAEREDQVNRSQLLPAAIEVLVEAGDHDRAATLTGELDRIAAGFGCAALHARAAYAAGHVQLATGDPGGALPYLRKSVQAWQSLGCPYEIARCQLLLGRTLRALGDEDSAVAELRAAIATFDKLGAKPSRREAEQLLRPTPPGGLTAREAEVLSLVATGRSNLQIAEALVLSEKTVARHLSNIFTKIDVTSRTAAAAYAFEHGLA